MLVLGLRLSVRSMLTNFDLGGYQSKQENTDVTFCISFLFPACFLFPSFPVVCVIDSMAVSPVWLLPNVRVKPRG